MAALPPRLPATLLGGEAFGDFTLLRKLATGGMAEVFLARRRSVLPGFAKLVAIKRMLPHLAEDPEFITMFLDEARTASHLNHPNVVQIFDVGEAVGTLYLAMEYLDGVSVMTLLQRNIELRQRQLAEGTQRFLPSSDADRPFDPLCAAAIGVQVCQGLHYAHEITLAGQPMGLVHRDISPQNLMLTFGGVVKVLDFGIAKAAGQASVTRAGALKGKLRYIAPEQYEFRPVDRRTDIYALGVVLYELATATRAFSGEDWEIVQKVQGGQVPPAHQLRGEIPTQLSAVIARAMAVDPEQRYQTAAALGEALLDVMRSLGQVVTAADLARMAQLRFGEERVDLSPFTSGEHRPMAAALPQASEDETLLPTTSLRKDRPPELEIIPDVSAHKNTGAVGAAPPAPELGWVITALLSLTPSFRPRHFWLYPALTSVALASALTIGGVRLAHRHRLPTLDEHSAQRSEAPSPSRSIDERGVQRSAAPSAQGAAQTVPPGPAQAATPGPITSRTPSRPGETLVAAELGVPAALLASPEPVPAIPPMTYGPPTPSPAPRKASTTPRVSYGYLVIDSKPNWSKVYAFGRLLGQTPIVKRYLPVGWTSLKVVNGKTQAQRVVRVHIKKGEVTTTLVRWQ